MAEVMVVRRAGATEVAAGDTVMVADELGVDAVRAEQVRRTKETVEILDDSLCDTRVRADRQVLLAVPQTVATACRETTWALLALLPAGATVTDADGGEWVREDDPVLGPVWGSRALRQTVTDPVLALRGPLTVISVPRRVPGQERTE